MRKFLGITFGVLGLLLLILVALPFLIPMDAYRGPIADAASRATGRDVRLEGPLRLSIYPELGVAVEEVSISNAEGAREPLMLSVGNMVLGVRLIPLISGRIEVVRLVLDEPVIHLEIAADGTPNWSFASRAVPTEDTAGAPAMDGTGINEFGIEQLSITDGRVTYYDAVAGTDAAVDDVDVSLSMPTSNSPLNMEGALTYNEERLELDADIERPRAFLDAESTPAAIALASNLLDMNFNGSFAATGQSVGRVDLDIPSLRALSAWTGNPLPPGENLGAMTLEADVTSEPNRIEFSGLRMSLDGMTITGDLGVDNAGAVPMLGGGLAIDRLDLNNYLVAGGGEADAAAGGGGGGGDAPLDLALLKAVNADLTLSIDELLFRNMRFQQAAMGAALDNGLLNAELREMALYGGSGRGTLVIDARDATPTFRHTLNVSGTDVQSFLTDFMEMDRITGTGTFVLDLATRGTTQNEIMNALSGSGNVDFRNGALRGVDLAAIARTIENVVNQGGLGTLTGGEATTEFTEFGGSFVIQNGIARNDDFRMVSPVVQILGGGEIDLAAQTMDFNVEPRPVAAGNVGSVDLANVGVTFRNHGPWNDLSYTPDLRGVARGVLQNVLGGGLGGEAPADAEEAQPANPAEQILQNPEEALRSLFGGFGGN